MQRKPMIRKKVLFIPVSYLMQSPEERLAYDALQELVFERKRMLFTENKARSSEGGCANLTK